MNLIRTEQIQVKGTKELSTLCHLSKNLYNQANYVVKQEFITTGNWIKGFDLIEKCKGFENYKLLNIQSAQLQSIYDKQGIKFGIRMYQLNSKRNNKIKDAMHKISRYTIDYCLENNIGTIVIGKNDNWKQETNMGKKNNQNFVQIPHFKLIQMLQYKAEAEGIAVKLQQESHTSKCSFLDSEPVCHQDTYKGVRFTRGLFRSANGTILNSDVNGAYNIIRKAIPDAFAKGIEDVGLHPIRSNAL